MIQHNSARPPSLPHVRRRARLTCGASRLFGRQAGKRVGRRVGVLGALGQEEELADDMADSASNLADALVEGGNIISSKSTILASTEKIANIIQKKMREYGSLRNNVVQAMHISRGAADIEDHNLRLFK